MKYDKFFQLAKEAGIEEAELYIGSSHTLSFSLFHGEVDNYSDNTGYTVLARGLINGKCGLFLFMNDCVIHIFLPSFLKSKPTPQKSLTLA